MDIKLQKQRQLIQEELILSLRELGGNQLDENLIISISNRISEKIDLKNSAIMHKGTRWIAQNIINHLNSKRI